LAAEQVYTVDFVTITGNIKTQSGSVRLQQGQELYSVLEKSSEAVWKMRKGLLSPQGLTLCLASASAFHPFRISQSWRPLSRDF
jgi:hypothetical protein